MTTTNTATSEPAPATDPADAPSDTPAAHADTSAPVTPESTGTPALIQLKHVLLKAIDLTALGFLEPIVRLCYGEEPQVQLRKIGQFVVVPSIAFVIFIGLWAALAPHHKTKSGEVPTPGVVADAYADIMTFHQREGAKEDGYLLTGPERERALTEAEAQLIALEDTRSAADLALTDAKEAHAAALAAGYDQLQDTYDQAKAANRAERKERETALKQRGAAMSAGDESARTAYLEDVRAHQRWIDDQKAGLEAKKNAADAALGAKFPPLIAAQTQVNALAGEQQFLAKLVEKLGEDNRAQKVLETETKLDEATAAFAAAEGTTVYTAAKKVIATEGRLATAETSGYAKPWTLPMQIVRSVVCVFVGFVMGSIIAIPIGILCGLSKTFMAAMTPFIALFKPVSPIVWLPIALIVVGGFIDDPDSHWLIQGLWEAPAIGWLKINPAFIASAITVALCSLWATMVNTALGVASVDKDHLNVAKVLRLNLRQRLFKIILPSSLPLVFAGLRISLGVGWMVLIAAELLASSEGIGKFVWDQFNNGASDSFAKMMVVVFVVGVIGLLLDRIMIIFQRLVSFEGSVAAI